ncbi:BTB domain-containing protein [Sergentomyia squamirostris]
MSVQQFCLRWNNHQPNFISVFSSLLHNETLVDVTLAADGSQLQAHKVVLSACSTYFESLFTSNPCRHPIVILKDVRYSDLKTLVDFMYYGEVNVSQERLPHIIKTAEMLKIKGLAEMSDAASLSKSESKSSSSDTEALTTNQTTGSAGLTTSQQQQQQQQQQLSTVQQTPQQATGHHIHSRRTPSPATMSPAARRKRLRKSSTGMPEYPIRKEHYVTDDDFRQGSGSVSTERTSGEDQHSSLEGGPGTTSTIHMSHMDPMSSFATASNLTSTISNARIMKDSPNSDNDQPQHDTSQESVDEQTSVQHHSIVVKTDTDLDHVSQPMPLDITGSSSSGPSVSQPQSQHSGVQWTVVESSYPRFALSSCPTNLGMSAGAAHNHPDHQQQQQGNGGSGGNSTTQSTGGGGTPGASGNCPSGENAGGSSSTTVHMTQYQSTSYPTQIISVNNYSQPLSTPTSPQGDSSLVQSVYSQGTTPNQSPIDTKPQLSQQQQQQQQQSAAPTPAPQKRKRSVNPQGDENFIRALEAVRYGGIGFCKAARLFGVNNRTLWLEYKKRGYPISRPSIKSRIKLEPNVSPQPPATPTNEENTIENYEHIAQPSINMPISTSTSSATPETPSAPIMCPPHAHPMGVMSFLDSRHVEFSSVHPMARQRYPDTPVNVNPTAMNLQGLNFNTM